MKLLGRIIVVAGLGTMAAFTASLPVRGQNNGKKNQKEEKSDDRATNLRIQVTGGEKDEPVAQASVYIRFQEPATLHLLTRRHRKVELDLKTDQQGVASFPDLPQGKILIQIVADGWSSFGEYYNLDQPRQTIPIKLQKPKTRWY